MLVPRLALSLVGDETFERLLECAIPLIAVGQLTEFNPPGTEFVFELDVVALPLPYKEGDGDVGRDEMIPTITGCPPVNSRILLNYIKRTRPIGSGIVHYL